MTPTETRTEPAAADRDAPDRRRIRRPSWAVLILVLSAAVKVGLETLAISSTDPNWGQYRMVDLDIYAESVRNVLDGQYLYGFIPTFTYPPFALLVMVPLGVLPWALVVPLFHFVKVLLIHLLAWRYLGERRLTGRRRVVWTIVAGWAGALLTDPLGQDISHGQVNIILMALIAFDLWRPRPSRWQGVGVGIAAGIKVVPGLFIVYLLVTRQFRAALVATLAFLGTVAVGFAVLPRASWDYWTSQLWNNSRVWQKPEVVLNQSVHGVVIRALGRDHTVLWLSLAALVCLAGLLLARQLHRHGHELAALSAVGMTAAVVTPQNWIHHWVWMAPALLIVAVGAGRSILAWLLYVPFFLLANSRPYFLIHGDPWRYDALHLTVPQQLFAANLIIVAAILAGLAVRWLRRTPAEPGTDPRPAPSIMAEPVATR